MNSIFNFKNTLTPISEVEEDDLQNIKDIKKILKDASAKINALNISEILNIDLDKANYLIKNLDNFS